MADLLRAFQHYLARVAANSSSMRRAANQWQPLMKASPETTPIEYDEGCGLLLHLRGNDATFAVSFATATVSAMGDPAGTRAVEEVNSASAWSAPPSSLRAAT